MKRIALFLAAVLILTASIPLSAYSLDLPLRVVVNGDKISFPDAQPFIDGNSRTQVPVRFVSEALGASVTWAGSTKTVTVTQGSKNIVLVVGKKEYIVNVEKKQMDTAALLKEGRTFVPLRFVSEALGAAVKWDEAIRTVYIDTNSSVTTTSGNTTKSNGYTVPVTTQLTVTGNDEFADQAFMISFYKKNADIKQQAIDLRNSLESKLGSKIANEVYDHIKLKITPEVNISEKYLFVESTKQKVWIKSSPSGNKTIEVLVSLPGKSFGGNT